MNFGEEVKFHAAEFQYEKIEAKSSDWELQIMESTSSIIQNAIKKAKYLDPANLMRQITNSRDTKSQTFASEQKENSQIQFSLVKSILKNQ